MPDPAPAHGPLPGLGGLRRRRGRPDRRAARRTGPAACPPLPGALSWYVGPRDPRAVSQPGTRSGGSLAHHAGSERSVLCAHFHRRSPRSSGAGTSSTPTASSSAAWPRGGGHPARQAPPLLRPPRRHRRPRDRRQRRQGRAHLEQGRRQAGLPPQRVPGRPALHQLRRAARGQAGRADPPLRPRHAAQEHPRPPDAGQAQGLRRPRPPARGPEARAARPARRPAGPAEPHVGHRTRKDPPTPCPHH